MLLKGYGKEIDCIFQLLGNHENDITKSIAYVISRCDIFAFNLLIKLGISKNDINLDLITITYQQIQEEGVSDIEIYYPGMFHIIIEAKIGFNLPSHTQLNKYANDLNSTNEPLKLIFTLSDSHFIEAESKINSEINNIPIKHIRYQTIFELIEDSIPDSNNQSKRMLNELKKFLKGVISMQDSHSNTVYVVPINSESQDEHNKERTYHCPVGNGFLKSPVNYLGFRFNGQLQYINHVESVETYKNSQNMPMFKFHLGPDIIPNKIVKTGGNFRGTKFYCDIDLLLTCDTIIEARKKTDQRHR